MLASGSTIGMSAMQQSGIYGNDRVLLGLDVEYGSDPASGGFFSTDYKKHDDLKQMLDSNKDGLKLEAMKRIIGMIARGRDASDLFPAVVKNVVSKNIEVKKLVYVYLVRYAEEQQDLALLSISTFQRALKDPNQLIRASALRVLSSVRVNMIVPIVMLAIRESTSDMSPYVRKTAAHAIPKLYSLDPEQKDELVMVIEKLLSDRATLVVGSAVMAFEEVCPERVDLIHKNYRILCNLLVDVDEWGQVVIINMLTRYARTQFANPNLDDFEDAEDKTNQPFYADSSCESDTNNKAQSPKNHPKSIDLDHRMLLRQTKPLLQSRNASIVMSVAQLYHHVAPRNEVNIIAKALIRLLRCHKEIQSVVLICIASMSIKRKSIFEPHLKSFFIRTSDPTHIKLLKLDILTNLASATSISVILREFQTYIRSSDKPFVAATIQAIGRCAASIKEVTETCLSGLVQLLSNRDEYVVAESVVVIKKLLQTKAAEHFEIISQMAKILDYIQVPAARASILWLIGEYNEKVPKIAPDVLRKMAKTFVDEEDVVKLQVLNLAIKLYLINPEQTSLLFQYVFSLARYDSNYDIRDRARFLRQFIFPANREKSILSTKAASIFLAPKPAPALESKYQGRNSYQLGSLSHYLNVRATGYNDLPEFPKIPPDSSVRNIEGPKIEIENIRKQKILGISKRNKKKKITSDSEKSSEYSGAESTSVSSSSESSSEDVSSDKASEDQKTQNKLEKQVNVNLNEKFDNSGSDKTSDSASSTSSASSSDLSDSETESLDTDDSKRVKENQIKFEKAKAKANEMKADHKPIKKHNDCLDLLLDLEDLPPIGPIMTPSLGGFLTPGTPHSTLMPLNNSNQIDLVGPTFIKFQHEILLNKVTGYGLEILYRFTRAPHLYSASMTSIELVFKNHTNDDILNIHMGFTVQPSIMNVNEFSPIQILQSQQCVTSIIGIDFNDSTHPFEFDIISNIGKAHVSLKSPCGELIRSVRISEEFFKQERTKLRGMNEHQCKISKSSDIDSIKKKVLMTLNVSCILSSNSNIILFSGQTMTSKSLVLIQLELSEEDIIATVNCEKMVIGSMLLNEIRNCLQ